VKSSTPPPGGGRRNAQDVLGMGYPHPGALRALGPSPVRRGACVDSNSTESPRCIAAVRSRCPHCAGWNVEVERGEFVAVMGKLRLGQVDADEHRRLSRSPHRRPVHAGRSRRLDPRPQPARRDSQPLPRVRLSVVSTCCRARPRSRTSELAAALRRCLWAATGRSAPTEALERVGPRRPARSTRPTSSREASSSASAIAARSSPTHH